MPELLLPAIAHPFPDADGSTPHTHARHEVVPTSRRQDATTLIGPLLGIPPLPHVDLPHPGITTSHPNGYLWKRDHVDGRLGDAPAVWIDDDFTDPDHSWAAGRTASGAPTLLVQPNPRVGLRAEHLAEARVWAGRLRDTRTAAPAAPIGTEAA
ncbi:hypothetical protein [Streptomyces rubradiris]|uniref:hypothetical protein n=1 Tax=Streptomyces rubradiris TaxID=285531 RepID=UPI001679BF5F